IQQAKQQSFNKLWHSDAWVKEHVEEGAVYDYSKGGTLALFTGTHPAVMQKRVRSEHWTFEYDPANVRQPLKEQLLDWLESLTGVRIGEYKNYELL
ncbi:MAG: glycosyltransferase family 2 protein, partial [Bacteroidota bacterium]